MKAPKRSTKEHKCLCAISTWESAITFGSDIKSDRYIKGMMDGFPYRSDHENVWRMYSHAEMRSKGRTDGHTEMTRDEGKKCPMINGPRTHDKWTNDPWKIDQWWGGKKNTFVWDCGRKKNTFVWKSLLTRFLRVAVPKNGGQTISRSRNPKNILWTGIDPGIRLNSGL